MPFYLHFAGKKTRKSPGVRLKATRYDVAPGGKMVVVGSVGRMTAVAYSGTPPNQVRVLCLAWSAAEKAELRVGDVVKSNANVAFDEDSGEWCFTNKKCAALEAAGLLTLEEVEGGGE